MADTVLSPSILVMQPSSWNITVYVTFTEMWLGTMGANITKDVVKLFVLVSSELCVVHK